MLKQALKGYVRDQLWGLRGLAFSEAPRLPADPRSILFLCKGNVCRSPFAEYRMRRFMEGYGITVFSAGLRVDIQGAPPLQAHEAAREFGVDLSDHLSKQVNKKMMDAHDIVFVMELRQIQLLKQTFPGYEDRIYLLPLQDKKDKNNKVFYRYNIPDPYGKSHQEYEACYHRIEECLANLSLALIHQGTSNE